MNRTVRGIIFWTFIVFFLIAAPLSVLYTAGFRYNAKNGSFVRTGVISVTSNPRNAEIFLNGETTEKATPFVLKRVLPGEYNISFVRKNFHPWDGIVKVESGLTTELQDVRLFMNVDPVQHVIRAGHNISPSPDGRRVAFTITEGGWREIWIFEHENESSQLVDQLNITSDQDAAPELVWSADGSRLLVNNANKVGDILAYTSSGTPLEIPSEELTNESEGFWHPSAGNIVYISTGEELLQYDFDTKEATVFDDGSAVSVLIDASVLSFVDNGTQTELRQTINNEDELIALLPRAEYTIEERDASIIILTDRRENLFLIDIRANQPILLETNAHVYDWDNNINQLVFSDGNEVNIYTPATHTTEFVTRQSAFIESISWHSEGNIVLVGTKSNLSAIEAQKIAESRFITNLTNVQKIDTFWLTNDEKSAYFYGIIDGASGIYSLELTR